jgi:hypothetical protein
LKLDGDTNFDIAPPQEDEQYLEEQMEVDDESD